VQEVHFLKNSFFKKAIYGTVTHHHLSSLREKVFKKKQINPSLMSCFLSPHPSAFLPLSPGKIQEGL